MKMKNFNNSTIVDFKTEKTFIIKGIPEYKNESEITLYENDHNESYSKSDNIKMNNHEDISIEKIKNLNSSKTM